MNLGESLAREWEDDPLAPELEDSLKLMETDPLAGLKDLERLAKAGSALSMTNLGLIHVAGHYGLPKNFDMAEEWLSRAAEAGSIEGCYLWAKHLQLNKMDKYSIDLYEYLSGLGYTPAMHAAGVAYYRGELVEKDLSKASAYFQKASDLGHLPSRRWISHILMNDRASVTSWLRGAWMRIKLFRPMLHLVQTNKKSDFLRT